jgi:hypothetical protein
MTRIMAALVPGHDGKIRRQEVDNLAFAFIAPLGAQHTQIHAASMIPFSLACIDTLRPVL